MAPCIRSKPHASQTRSKATIFKKKPLKVIVGLPKASIKDILIHCQNAPRGLGILQFVHICRDSIRDSIRGVKSICYPTMINMVQIRYFKGSKWPLVSTASTDPFETSLPCHAVMCSWKILHLEKDHLEHVTLRSKICRTSPLKFLMTINT